MFDADGDLFVTGRVDDMIITGGENVSPVEIESCLSLHPAVSEVAVVGLPDERWGKVVTAFIKRSAAVEHEHLDAHCRESGLANFKRPRRYVFVEAIPKSPVGKLLRRLLVAGEYEIGTNRSPLTRNRRMSSPATFDDPRLATLDGFRVEIDEARERADIILDRPPLNVVSMPQRDQLRLVFESLDENSRVRIIVLRADRRALLQRRQHQGLHGGAAGNGVEARLEYRGAGALLEAGDRGQPRLLLRRRLRAVARLRLPHRLGDRLLRAARAAARANPRLRRLGAACRRSSASPAPRTS